MLTRFELVVVLRNQVSDRTIVRRSLAVEVAMESLARLAGADAALWGLAGLGAEIDAQLCASSADRRGAVAEELLLTEGAPPEVAAAAREKRGERVDEMGPIAQALVVADRLVDEVLGACEDGGLDAVEAFAVAHRIRRAAEKRDEEAAKRVLEALAKRNIAIEPAAEAVLAALKEIRQDLRL